MSRVSTECTIIIPQHGKSELTLQCLGGLRESDVRSWPVIVVSDGCPPKELDRLQKGLAAMEGVSLVRQEKRGVSAAWNLGASQCNSEFLVFLNNDVVCHGDWGERFLQPLTEHRSWICGVQIRRETELKRLGKLHALGDELFEGWCLGMRNETFRRLGGFDESLLHYWSDTDLQLRGGVAFGDSSWRKEGLVEGLPLVHLRHRTSHDASLKGKSIQTWSEDRRRFRAKWSKACNGR